MFGCTSKPEPPRLTVSELQRLYPVPVIVGGQSGWELFNVNSRRIDYEADKTVTGAELRALADATRADIAAGLRQISEAQHATYEFIGTRLPHYSIADLADKLPYVLEVLETRAVFFNRNVVQRRVKEHAGRFEPHVLADYPRLARLAADVSEAEALEKAAAVVQRQNAALDKAIAQARHREIYSKIISARLRSERLDGALIVSRVSDAFAALGEDDQGRLASLYVKWMDGKRKRAALTDDEWRWLADHRDAVLDYPLKEPGSPD